MKKSLLLLLPVVIIISSFLIIFISRRQQTLPPALLNPQPVVGMQTYRNDQYSFEFQYPQNWHENKYFPEPDNVVGFFQNTMSNSNGWYLNVFCNQGLPQRDVVNITTTKTLKGIAFPTVRSVGTFFTNGPDQRVSPYVGYKISSNNNFCYLNFKARAGQQISQTEEDTAITGFDQILSTFKFTK